MKSLDVRKALRDAKILLLMQNEIGQIVGRRLTRSENHEETRSLLTNVKHSFLSDPNNPVYIVSDNAQAIRNMVDSVLGGSVSVKQDPFHVMQRIAEKIKASAHRKAIYKKLKAAMYVVTGELRNPKDMTANLRAAMSTVKPTDVSCSHAEWNGCVESNLKQIERGDVFVEHNSYEEAGEKASVVSTSELDGFHSALKRLLSRSVAADVGLRLLDVFILDHNLRVGARYGRNPAFHHADFVTVARSALVCRGILAESP
ncbi:hypothetical protein BBJ28_00026613 [Nothophytophthora sp. Chile5]|nr:hypothetical protein BBJ28_00026613 [Nothophytophthora sp. Chile5]